MLPKPLFKQRQLLFLIYFFFVRNKSLMCFLEFHGTSQFVRCFLPAQTRVWNDDLPCTVFDTGTLDGFKGAVNRWLLS